MFYRNYNSQSGIAHGQSIEVCSRGIQLNFDTTTKLIDNFKTIKLAIIRANSGIDYITADLIDRVEVLNEKMTISEMLCIHSYIIPLYKKLLEVMEAQYDQAIIEVDSGIRSVN